MDMTIKAVATAKRNLAQRVERFLVEAPEISGWQADQVLQALDDLRGARYRSGEDAMMHAERPDVWEKPDHRVSDRTDAADLLAELARTLEE